MTREDKQSVISVCRILADKMDDSGKVAVEQVISAVRDLEEQLPEQEPCEDAVSRQAVLDAMSDTWKHICSVARRRKPTKGEEAVYSDMVGTVKSMPPVTPKHTEITLESAIDYLHSIGWLQKHDKELTESAEKQRTGHWIPVSEKLPDKYTHTLWCASSGYVRSDYFNGEFWVDAKKYDYEVIAWMPLPEPYESQESEEQE